MKSSNKGFTLIELLVVIAIIGILASVVLASLNTARNKGADAATKANLANARVQAEIFYDTANNYTTVCSTGTGNIAANIAAAASSSGGTVVCSDEPQSWVVSAPLKGGGHWCVDHTGASRQIAAAAAADAVICPAAS